MQEEPKSQDSHGFPANPDFFLSSALPIGLPCKLYNACPQLTLAPYHPKHFSPLPFLPQTPSLFITLNMANVETGTVPVSDEKALAQHKESMMGDVAHDAAERGHLATDEYGQALVEFDKAAESRLRLKIDLYIVPTVAVMYLFCFIDRANIGAQAILYS